MRSEEVPGIEDEASPGRGPLAPMRRAGRNARSVIGLTAFDTATAGGRSRERWRRIALTSLSSIGLRGVSLVSKLAVVPLALGHLGPERYGLLLTITALGAWFSLADVGIGSGLRNAVATASGTDGRRTIRGFVASAYVALSVIAFVIAVVFAVAFPWVPWPALFNVATPQAAAEAAPAAAVFIACVLVGVPLSVASQTQIGLQEGFVTNAWSAFGSIVGLVGMICATTWSADLPWVVLVVAGAPLIAALANTVTVLAWSHPWLRPRLRDVRYPAMKELGSSGLLFLGLQVGSAVVMFTDTLVVAHLFGAAEVPSYAVPWQLFSTLAVLLGLVLLPFWPAFAEAISHGDIDWVRTTLRRSYVISLGISVPAVVLLVALAPLLLQVWVGATVDPPFLLLAGFGVSVVIVNGLGGPLAMFLNGAHALKLQLVWLALGAVANLALSILFGRTIGLPGVILGTIVAELTFGILPYLYHVPRLLAAMEATGSGRATTDADEGSPRT